MRQGKAHMRVSFAGGGSDLQEFYRFDIGAVVSVTIKQAVTATITTVIAAQHALELDPLTRAVFEAIGERCDNCLVQYRSDVPPGSGLGGSSAAAVALLRALRPSWSPLQLAETACTAEQVILGEPIGRQDQFAAAYGGFNYMEFMRLSTAVTQLKIAPERLAALQSHMEMFHTGTVRAAGDLLRRQQRRMSELRVELTKQRDAAYAMACMMSSADIYRIGELMDECWKRKLLMADGITNVDIDSRYRRALAAGGWGGKLLGAGGGGYFLMVRPPDVADAVAACFAPWPRVPVEFQL